MSSQGELTLYLLVPGLVLSLTYKALKKMLCFRFHHKFSIGSVGRLFFFFFFPWKIGVGRYFFFFLPDFLLTAHLTPNRKPLHRGWPSSYNRALCRKAFITFEAGMWLHLSK